MVGLEDAVRRRNEAARMASRHAAVEAEAAAVQRAADRVILDELVAELDGLGQEAADILQVSGLRPKRFGSFSNGSRPFKTKAGTTGWWPSMYTKAAYGGNGFGSRLGTDIPFRVNHDGRLLVWWESRDIWGASGTGTWAPLGLPDDVTHLRRRTWQTSVELLRGQDGTAMLRTWMIDSENESVHRDKVVEEALADLIVILRDTR